MESKIKRIGYLPRKRVLEIIDEISKSESISRSKVVGILVEEALDARGIANFGYSNISKSIPYKSDNYKENLNENIHLKDRLISVSTQKTNYSKKKLLKILSVLNAMLNRRFLTRNYMTRTDRVIFYSFLEKSPSKKLLHSHMILRVPKFIMTNYEK